MSDLRADFWYLEGCKIVQVLKFVPDSTDLGGYGDVRRVIVIRTLCQDTDLLPPSPVPGEGLSFSLPPPSTPLARGSGVPGHSQYF